MILVGAQWFMLCVQLLPCIFLSIKLNFYICKHSAVQLIHIFGRWCVEYDYLIVLTL
ncbi:hypothetical protein CBL_00359 [Carabus blaptoides fortunei]